jgi:hypothetical protein
LQISTQNKRPVIYTDVAINPCSRNDRREKLFPFPPFLLLLIHLSFLHYHYYHRQYHNYHHAFIFRKFMYTPQMLVAVNKLERRIPETHLSCWTLRTSGYKSSRCQISCNFLPEDKLLLARTLWTQAFTSGLRISREIKSVLFTPLLSVYTIYRYTIIYVKNLWHVLTFRLSPGIDTKTTPFRHLYSSILIKTS